MSRSFRDLLKLSAPVLLSAALLSGCGSGSSGSADLDSGGGPPVTQPPPPVTSSTTFDFNSTVDWFVVGTPPIHARFSGGAANASKGAWIVPAGKTGVVDFGTPADTVKFTTKSSYRSAASTGAGAQKTGGKASRQAVTNKFSVPMFLRGIGGDWSANPVRKFSPHSCDDNVLVLRLELGADISEDTFKIAAEDWLLDPLNCGKNDTSDLVTVNTPYNMVCRGGLGLDAKLTIPSQARWKFTFDVRDENKPVLTITEDSPDDCGGNGGGGPPPNSTEIRVYGIDALDEDAEVQLLTTLTDEGTGSINVEEVAKRTGGSPRITRVEIENLGTAGDIGIEDFSWTADARFALKPVTADIFYTLPSGSAAGMKIVVGGRTYDCVAPPPNTAFSCVARNVEVTPFANQTMTVRNADGSTRDTIIFNGGSGDENVFAYSGTQYATTGSEPVPPPAILNAAAHWVSAGTLVYNPPAGTAKVELLYSPNATISTAPSGFAGTFQTIALTSTANPKPPFNKQLHTLPAWSLGAAAANAKDFARGQLVAVARGSNGAVLSATYVQTAGALDDLYAAAAYGQTLGVSYSNGVPSLAVWAPTALKTPGVSVNIYDAAGTKLETVPMTLDEASGIWRVTGNAGWDLKFYTISLSVYSPHYASNAIVANEVTDPYSVSLAADSVRSQFVDLNDADLKPAGWDTLQKPALGAPEDIVIYELHVRDFSIADSSVPADDRGMFTAFDVAGTAGRNHLQQLAQAGLTHVHILPAFDIATVKEDSADRVDINDPVEELCAANAAAAPLCQTYAGKTIRQAMEAAVASGRIDFPQQIVGWMRALDGFNWGYDPFHFGVPEGSYSTDPNGPTRIREFRRMVKGLNDLGLRTVMDVVYNHTNASGQNTKSVLDKVVPGYYHRRANDTGNVLRDTCCDDTASEFQMMEKLMIDTGKTWVEQYKVSGFRFDLSGFHTLDNMLKFQSAVKAIDPSTYIYGEAWNFGAVENDARFTQARQANLGGTGIGSFSDRIRDPVRGGGPFDSGNAFVKNQGFINGWFYDPNSLNSGSVAERQALITATDNIRVWLAGGLEDFQLQNAAGQTVPGKDIDYNGQDSGYTEDPSEGINYVEKHDNQTVWDLSAYKHPDATSLADRVRAHNVGQSLILLGQGIPFLHAGTEILRSKSGDRNSYDSGDWFNELDWTLSGTKWAQGLPVDYDNKTEWPFLETKYQTVPRPDHAAQQRAFDHVREMLRIRKSSTLFRLRDAAQVEQRVKFYNTGPSQMPGVIAMGIDGCTNENEPVPDKGAYMVVFNASDDPQTLALFTLESWTLHPVLASSTDPVVKTAKHDANGFYVPARTTAVFERAQQTSCPPLQFTRTLFVRGLGPSSDWSASPANQFIYKGGTLYEAYLTGVVAGPDEFGFKIADNDPPSGYNDGTNCGVSNQSVVFGVPLTLACRAPGNDNIGFTAPTAGNYLFRLDAVDVAAPQLTVINSPFARQLYVRGLGAGSDWSASPAARLEKPAHSAVYQVLLNVAAGPDEFGFKIADNDPPSGYNDGTNCGSTTALTIGQPLPLACQGPGNDNIQVNFPSAGVYSFSLDATVTSAPTLTVQKPPYPRNLFIRGLGAGSDWSANPDYRLEFKGGTVYESFRMVAAGADEFGFKIADNDPPSGYNDGTNCGATTALTIGQALTLACTGPGNDNIQVTFPTAGIYRFRLDAANPAAPQLTVTGP